ncbi:M24 family metallopeptidase [Croceicoccus sp. F390]|uniref:M24 family metallopeptidase n=1 Tax=Croceicoccus esteveae TaxID=3075597 RepID=A0ABU2ZH39_9SPHN|nr:M24 family metallopeptidase [Croceicoccus sp. F390]MDT0575922.1 M24 family metallopeptidase [Croceicoccus sp. F390]
MPRIRAGLLGTGAALTMLWAGTAMAQVPTAADAQTNTNISSALREVEEPVPQLPAILPLRERAAVRDAWLAERLDTVVPALMRENGIDMWVMVAREYLEDPVVSTMLNATSMRARRRTILIFHDPGEGQPLERLTVSRYGLGGLFDPAWDPEQQKDQWRALAELVTARNPEKIAINTSALTAFGDGLTLSQYEGMMEALPQGYRQRIVNAENLAVGWLETRIPAEMMVYPDVVRLAHAIIAEGLSRTAITPGVTTAEDVEWWYRERIAGLKLATWFHPSVHIIRQGVEGEISGPQIIQPGDLLWTDFGIVYLGLNTDTQHLAYVLKPGETEAPQGLRDGLAAANRVQDALTSSYRTGMSGNEILAAARAKSLAQGLRPSIYTHPIGYHGHAAGAAIGFWDDQGPSDKGEYRLRPNTAWSIELSATHAVPEWGGQDVAFKTEEDAFFDGTSVRYIDGRQTQFQLIPAQ